MRKLLQLREIVNASLVILPILIIGIIYAPWISFSKTLSSGDWPYLFRETIRSLPLFGNGQSLWLDGYYYLTAKFGVQILGFGWEAIEKLFWFFPFLVISLVCSWVFIHHVLETIGNTRLRRALAAVGSLIYVTNSYILMIVGGGQMGVAMGYSLAPGVLFTLSRSGNASRASWQLTAAGIVLAALQLMFDPRLFVITMFGSIILVGRNALVRLFLMIGVAIMLNAFWMLPNALAYRDLYAAATNGDIIGYLSFSTFSNAISLLHPNWPENIFGKIGFMKPEFLILPIIAFMSLLTISKIKNSREAGSRSARQKSTIISFTILALVGAFLAKGVNPPFGEVYRWLSFVPGFMIFRDPTKFYLLVALSYSILIPYALGFVIASLALRGMAIPVFERLRSGARNDNPILLYAFLLLWVFIHRQAVLGQLTGTFQPRRVPEEYVILKDFLLLQEGEFTTLWVPRYQRFGFYTPTQRALSSQDVLLDAPALEFAEAIATEGGRRMLAANSVRFVITPLDSRQEIFLTDRSYDANKRREWEEALDTVDWFRKTTIPGINAITVYNVIQ